MGITLLTLVIWLSLFRYHRSQSTPAVTTVATPLTTTQAYNIFPYFGQAFPPDLYNVLCNLTRSSFPHAIELCQDWRDVKNQCAKLCLSVLNLTQMKCYYVIPNENSTQDKFYDVCGCEGDVSVGLEQWYWMSGLPLLSPDLNKSQTCNSDAPFSVFFTNRQ